MVKRKQSKPSKVSSSSNVESSSSSPTKVLLSGFGRPLNYAPSKKDPDYVGEPFGNALSLECRTRNCTLPLTTVREFVMLQYMNSITDKPDWHVEVNKPEVTTRWKADALTSKNEDLTEKMVDYCLDELRYKSTLIPSPPTQAPPVIVYNGDVMKSDIALSPKFKTELQQGVQNLEASISEKRKDWHPGSDGKVWDLVDPSLYPLVYGRTRILENGERTTLEDCIERSGQGQIIDVPSEAESHESSGSFRGQIKVPYSTKFQWLPCEVDISEIEGVRITSYINNLHPQKEKPLYHVIERLIDACIPLWSLTLAPQVEHQYIRRRIAFEGINYEGYPPGDDTLYDEDDEEIDWDTIPFIRPEPKKPFEPKDLNPPSKFNLREKYGKHGLQVVVKLVNIELTPEKPQYDGGPWHLEGQLNEHIVATALYYYSDSNITRSSVSFRQWFDNEEDTCELYYKQPYYDWCPAIFGCEQDTPSIQDVGGVETREGRLLTFPNTMQHHVDPFKLADPTKPGHRKIVALFLVDPNIKVISTAHVPCQQQEWWADSATEKASRLERLPRELKDLIVQDVDFPFSFQAAKSLKEELVKERKELNLARWRGFEKFIFGLGD